MKKIIISALALSSLLTVSAAEPDKAEKDSVETLKFTDVIAIPVTSVKNQNKSGTCWCFAGTSFYENEIRKATGDSLDLSEMFSVRHCYADKADKYVRTYGKINFSPGGSALDVPYVWARYGAMPEEVYSGLQYGEDKHVHGELDATLKGYVDAVVRKPNRRVSTAWREGLEGILDAYLGSVPETFEYKGKTYTPQSYAASLGISPDNYIGLTSFTHHPFYEPFAIEVSDNWLWADYQNVPMAELREVVDNALANGYTVVWAADVSEPGFKWKEGYATMPAETKEDLKGTELSRWVKVDDDKADKKDDKKSAAPEEITVTQESRQAMFDRQETTDDHGMEIVGLAEDQYGNKYYKVKNSWGTDQIYDGYLYVSMPYFDAKTVDIYVNKKAVPKAIAKKLGI